jgi:hypothetical protein
MKRPITLTFLVGALANATHADSNPLSLADGMVVFDVQERLRLDNQDNMFDFNRERSSPDR